MQGGVTMLLDHGEKNWSLPTTYYGFDTQESVILWIEVQAKTWFSKK